MLIPKDIEVYPLMGHRSDIRDYATIDLSADTLSRLDVKDEDDLKAYLAKHHQSTQSKYLWGGYLEHRSLYQSDLFKRADSEVRDIHLGIDIWGIVYEQVHAPIDGTIHSFAYNDGALDYGYTLILSHRIDEVQFYTLYGHLGPGYYPSWKEGKSINAGDAIADLGPPDTNGGWLPHLHFQVMMDMEGRVGDFPGVCSRQHLRKWKALCPNPQELIAPLRRKV